MTCTLSAMMVVVVQVGPGSLLVLLHDECLDAIGGAGVQGLCKAGALCSTGSSANSTLPQPAAWALVLA